ncbi:hypothetical protein EON83_23920 [bacterium]|nr:MAG: hypothetical protein EON83_23920 [bacterium]
MNSEIKRILKRAAMKRRLLQLVKVAAGAFAGSSIVGSGTSLSVTQLMPIVHDVEFIFLGCAVSALGGVFGAAAVIALLATKHGRFQMAGWISGTVGIWGILLPLPLIINAPASFTQNGQPYVDALAYSGCTIACASALFMWGFTLLLKHGPLAQRPLR